MRDSTLSAWADQELIDALRRDRSEPAFRELHRRHTPRLLRLIMRMIGSPVSDAEDLVQETWIRGVEKLSTFRGDARFGTWLTSIGIRISQDHLRRNKRAHLQLEAVAEPWRDAPPHAVRLDLEEVLSRLPEIYRSVLLLHDLEGYTHADIGRLMGIAEGTSKSRLSEARKLAQALFEGRDPVKSAHKSPRQKARKAQES